MLGIDAALIGFGVTLVGTLIVAGFKVKKEVDEERIEKQIQYNKTKIEEYEMKLKQLELEERLNQAQQNLNKSNKDTEGLF